MENKRKGNKIWIVAAVAVIAIALIVVLAIVVPKYAEASKVTEQLNLGDKYLSELDYEQAAVAYQTVIEINPKNVDAYLALVEVYVAQKDYDKAIDVLEDAADELSGDAKDKVKNRLKEVKKLKKQAEAAAMPVPTAEPTTAPTATSTPVPTATSTPIPTATSTPTPEPTPTETPEPTVAPRATATPTPRPTSTPTPAPTATPKPVTEGEIRVELELGSDCFTYGIYDDIYVCTGLSEKGYNEFRKYNSGHLVSIRLPGTSDTGETVKGFYSNSDGGYDLYEMLTEESAYLELVCADGYTNYYGVMEVAYAYDHLPDSKKLADVILNDGMEYLASCSFYGCEGIKQIEIPDSVKRFGSSAFSSCVNLVIDRFEIGGKSFEGGVFYDVRINTLTISENVAEVDGYSGSFNGLQVGKVEISDTVTELSGSLFMGLKSLTEITLPNSIKKIGNNAFSSTGIKELVIPDSVEEIEHYAFWLCEDLTKITIPDSVGIIGDAAFGRCGNVTIHTPSGSYAEAYALENNIPVETY